MIRAAREALLHGWKRSAWRRSAAQTSGAIAVYPVIATFAYSDEWQAAYAAPPFPAPTPPGAPPVKALRARVEVIQPGHG
jgi:hypothetical protein